MRQRFIKLVRKWIVAGTVLLSLAAVWCAHAQFFGGEYSRNPEIRAEEIKEQQEMEQALTPGFKEDVFTFARLRWSAIDQGYRFGGGRLWDDDAPEADRNLIYRLFQVTSLKVRPGVNYIDITPEQLAKYPLVYMASSGRVVLTNDEAAALRHYLLNGGFLMVDDFWGDDQWHHFYEQIKRVFPDREPVEVPLSHQIFNIVFNFKQAPQIPSVGSFLRSGLAYDPGWPYGAMGHDPHYFAIYDDKQRMMVIICHNNHYGDGWEHETDDTRYFDRFSVPMGYPMFINITTYVMSH